jgi:hypothetical protein
MNRVLRWLGIVGGLIGLLSSAALAQTNLLADPGFENPPGAWVVEEGGEITDTGARSGARALRMTGASTRAWTSAPGLKPGQFYRVDIWARTQGLPAASEGYVILYLDGHGSTRANLDDHDWEPVTLWFQAKDDKPFRIYLIRSAVEGGEIWFDDLSLRECEDPNLAPLTFEDGTAFGAQFYGHPGTIARVVKAPSPAGGQYSLLGAPASIGYRMPQDLTAGLVEFDFMVNLPLEAAATFAVGSLRLDLAPTIKNTELRQGSVGRQTLGAFTPGRWYRFRGIINLDTQRYDLEVTDYEDPLYSFTRKNLLLGGEMKSVRNYWLSSPKQGGLWDNLYFGPVRAKP